MIRSQRDRVSTAVPNTGSARVPSAGTDRGDEDREDAGGGENVMVETVAPRRRTPQDESHGPIAPKPSTIRGPGRFSASDDTTCNRRCCTADNPVQRLHVCRSLSETLSVDPTGKIRTSGFFSRTVSMFSRG